MHVLVANMTRAAEGEWRALDGEAILKTYRLAAGYLYEAHLRHELTRRLGVEWTEPVKGMSELVGVPEEAIKAFSTRRQSLVEHMEALGTEGFAASRVAALATREAGKRVRPSTGSAAASSTRSPMDAGDAGSDRRRRPRDRSARSQRPHREADDLHHARARAGGRRLVASG